MLSNCCNIRAQLYASIGPKETAFMSNWLIDKRLMHQILDSTTGFRTETTPWAILSPSAYSCISHDFSELWEALSLMLYIIHWKVISSSIFLSYRDSLLLAVCIFESFCSVPEEGTTKLEYPRIYKAQQHLFILTMNAFILPILYVVIHCHTGKFNMYLPLLCREFECLWKYYLLWVILWNNRAFWRTFL